MEDLEENIQNIEIKISRLNNFIALCLRRNKLSKELEQITLDAIKVRDLMTEAHELMQKDFQSLLEEFDEVMSQMRKKQILVMGYVIKEKQRKINEVEEEEKKVQLILSSGKSNTKLKSSTAPKSAIKKLGVNLAKLNLNHALSVTPKIKISEYKESPMVKKRINPLVFQFQEFDITITQQQFDTIPKYMCGRETLEQLNSFLETVIIPCFNEKYQLMHKERSCLRNLNDLELWKLYNEQASSLPDFSIAYMWIDEILCTVHNQKKQI
ncbi:uncharacterized protein ACRADG_007760 isoform 2-T2 [Cochliomyia hominivorax]